MIYIATVRKGQKLPEGQSEDVYKRLDKFIRSYCGLIFNPVATMDWVNGNATMQSVSSLAEVIDSAFLRYIMPEPNNLVFTYEILKQCQERDLKIQVLDLPPIPQTISDNSSIRSPLGILVNQVPGYLDKEQAEKIRKVGEFPTEVPFKTAQ